MSKVEEIVDELSDDSVFKLRWSDYPVINYSMLPVWVKELTEVGGDIVDPFFAKERLDPDNLSPDNLEYYHELLQRFIELSHLCGTPLPGTYKDAQGNIRNDNMEGLGEMMIRWKSTRN